MFNVKNNKKKIINLLPKRFLEERKFEKAKRSVMLLSIIPIGIYGFTFIGNGIKEDNLEKAKLVQEDIIRLNSQIKSLESDVFKNTRIINGLMNEHIPLNYFLLDLNNIAPADMVLYSVISENMALIEDSKENEDGTAVIPTEETLPEEAITEDEYKDIGGGETVEYNEDGTIKEEISEEEKQAKEEKEIKSQKTIFIRGAVDNVDSIGNFIKHLEEKSYISKVDMNKIENYYNSANSYKVFELVVEIK